MKTETSFRSQHPKGTEEYAQDVYRAVDRLRNHYGNGDIAEARVKFFVEKHLPDQLLRQKWALNRHIFAS